MERGEVAEEEEDEEEVVTQLGRAIVSRSEEHTSELQSR